MGIPRLFSILSGSSRSKGGPKKLAIPEFEKSHNFTQSGGACRRKKPEKGKKKEEERGYGGRNEFVMKMVKAAEYELDTARNPDVGH